MLATFNLQQWIEEHRHLLKPPVGNAQIWTDREFIVMIVGGPNSRKDYHVDPGEEFYQVEGDIVLKVVEDGQHRDIPIRQGDIFLLPGNVPHSPQRPANTVGLVIERIRQATEEEHFRWYCEGCGDLLHDTHFVVTDIVAQLPPIFDHFYGSDPSLSNLQDVRDGDGASATSFMKIDLHTHILPRDWPDLASRYGYGPWPRMVHHTSGCARIMIDEQLFREIEENCWDADRRLEECKKHRVDVQVLSTVPVMFSYWARPRDTLDLSRILNDHIASVTQRYPRNFVGLGTLPMQAPDLAAEELRRCVQDLGFPGAMIGSHVNKWNLDEEPLFEFFAAAAELNAALFVHPWDMWGLERMPRYFLPWLVAMPAETSLAMCSIVFSGLLDRLPNLRLCFAHGGGSFPMTIGRIDRGFSGRPDLCQVNIKQPPSSYLRRLYIDSLVHDAEVLRYNIQLFGADRVMLGSDYPFPLGEAEPGALIESMSGLEPEVQAQLLGGTALEFLGLKAATFSTTGAHASQD